MPRKALRERAITVPEVRKILESIGEEKLDQFQRRSLDYTAKFSKVNVDVVEELIKKSEDPLKTSMICSIIGNIMDFGIEGSSTHPKMLKEVFERR